MNYEKTIRYYETISARHFFAPTDAEKFELQNLEERMDHGERLKDWEKER